MIHCLPLLADIDALVQLGYTFGHFSSKERVQVNSLSAALNNTVANLEKNEWNNEEEVRTQNLDFRLYSGGEREADMLEN